MIPHHKFQKFNTYLEDEYVYAELEQFWIDFFLSILDKNSKNKNEWISPFYNTKFSKGKSMMNANPIFSAKSLKNEKIIRILQTDMGDRQELSHWINSTMDNHNDELVINCVLNEKNLIEIESLILNWIKS
ncbi:hypothetical protein [Lysinibacillus sp. G4S2]|uniref:hypothetical protein n=1 Tax=Lysinibacillus sp. G4S2 TaxID=3055859 RepID=UPI0025A1BC06|nr:hypothetical protein [Lysinibacillus sp. G4S2]MDM5249141.1 hypothetical protein [Lysinibacillus sp. G4S2]